MGSGRGSHHEESHLILCLFEIGHGSIIVLRNLWTAFSIDLVEGGGERREGTKERKRRRERRRERGEEGRGGERGRGRGGRERGREKGRERGRGRGRRRGNIVERSYIHVDNQWYLPCQ